MQIPVSFPSNNGHAQNLDTLHCSLHELNYSCRVLTLCFLGKDRSTLSIENNEIGETEAFAGGSLYGYLSEIGFSAESAIEEEMMGKILR